MKARLWILVVVLLSMSLVTFGCRGTPVPEATEEAETMEPEATVAATGIPSAEPEEESVLTFGAEQDLQNLDVQFSTSGSDNHPGQWVHCRLASYDKTMLDAIPQLAESWTVSEDGTRYVFKIREGVKFHNGREVTAEDVEYSFNRIMENADVARADEILYVAESFEATDRYEFTVELSAPDPTFLPNMGHAGLVVVPEENADTLDTSPVGCGPYEFVEYVPNDRLTVAKFEDYWDKDMLERLPDKIVFRPILEEQTRIAMLKSGQIDVAETLSAPNWETIREDPNLHLIEQEFSASYLIYLFNTVRGPTSDKDFRQALTYAIDREAVNQTALWGLGEIDCNIIPRGHWAYTEFDCPSYDPEKARQMLEDAGYGEEDIQLEIVTYDSAMYVPAGEVLVENLADVGIDAELKVVERGVWLEDAWFNGNFDITIAALTREPDPDGLMSSVFRKEGGNNPGNYHNPEVEELFEEGRSTLDREERKEIYSRIMEIILEDVPVTKVATAYRACAANDKVDGLYVWPKGFLFWHHLSYSP